MENHTSHALKAAKRLRQEMSLPEVLLWQKLKGRPTGVKFRKQHPIGNYVLDFYCAAQRVGIEVDGISHNMGDRPSRDEKRDRWLASEGIEVLRIAASDVLQNSSAVAESIIAYCIDRPPPPAAHAAATSPSGGGVFGARN